MVHYSAVSPHIDVVVSVPFYNRYNRRLGSDDCLTARQVVTNTADYAMPSLSVPCQINAGNRTGSWDASYLFDSLHVYLPCVYPVLENL